MEQRWARDEHATEETISVVQASADEIGQWPWDQRGRIQSQKLVKRQKPQDSVLVECRRGWERNKVVDFLCHLLGFYNMSAL